jgi:hypothetical protein
VLELYPDRAPTLLQYLIAAADKRLWARYCRLAAELEAGTAGTSPVYALGSVEQQREERAPRRGEYVIEAKQEAAGRGRLAQRGAPSAFAGAPSPLGAFGAAAFADFVASRRGPAELLAEIDAVEQGLVDAFERAGRAGHYCAVGFCNGAKREVEPEWFGRIGLDFAHNEIRLPDGSVIAGIGVTPASPIAAERSARERPARAILRKALVALWERCAFTAGTGNERVLALVLQELRLSASDPPYGFKSAETIRKLRKTLHMSG